jgi:hypothetical protein
MSPETQGNYFNDTVLVGAWGSAQDGGANAITITASSHQSAAVGRDSACQQMSGLPQCLYECDVRALADIQHSAHIMTELIWNTQSCVAFRMIVTFSCSLYYIFCAYICNMMNRPCPLGHFYIRHISFTSGLLGYLLITSTANSLVTTFEF